jgi:hypothetical protein
MAHLCCVMHVQVVSALGSSNSTVVPVVQVGQQTPTVSSGKIPWPLDPVTKQRYPGIKEFAIVLHDHLVYEKAELDAWFNHTYTQKLKNALAKLNALRNTTAKKTEPYLKRIALVEGQIAAVQKTLGEITQSINKREISLQQAQTVVLNTGINWNNTIAGLEMQKRAALSATADVTRISALLTDPKHREDIAKMLMTAQAKVQKQSSKVAR